MTIEIQVLPSRVQPSASDAQGWRDYVAYVQTRNHAIALLDARERAQADAEARDIERRRVEAMEAIVGKMTEAMADILAHPPASPRVALAERFLAAMPQITGMTDLQQVDLAFARADAFLRRSTSTPAPTPAPPAPQAV